MRYRGYIYIYICVVFLGILHAERERELAAQAERVCFKERVYFRRIFEIAEGK